MIEIPAELHQIRNPYLCVWMMGKTERVLEVSNYPRFAADPYVVSHHHTWLKERFTDYATKNTEAHIYKEDTPFVVTKDDYNFRDMKPSDEYTPFRKEWVDSDGEEQSLDGWKDTSGKFLEELPEKDWVITEGYRNPRGVVFKEGETAFHLMSEPLPGSFPLWLKREVDGEAKESYEFDLTGLPFPMSIIEVNINRGKGWEELDKQGKEVDLFRSFCNLTTRNIGGWYEGKVTILKREGDSDKVLVRISYHRRLRGL
jgi:hypothetical protein